mmetsp:Transcript_107013/g.333557  ORF Transcript_107013/g.333557 Transcript_107013/m.333557 type:complete len:253 (-) Transcript_107013:36-794(-)
MVHISAVNKAAEGLRALAGNGWRGTCEGKEPCASARPRTAARPPAPPSGTKPGTAAAEAVMTPVQEVANALTMLPVAVLALQAVLEPGASAGVRLVAASVLVHNPFSVAYHTSCAVNYGKLHPCENNPFLKWDISFIHVGGAILSLATSGSLAYSAASTAFNGVCIYRIAAWRGSTLERRLARVCCFLLYAVPIARIDPLTFARTMSIFLAMAAVFVFSQRLRGWGHALSHLLLLPFARCLLHVGGQVTAIS